MAITNTNTTSATAVNNAKLKLLKLRNDYPDIQSQRRLNVIEKILNKIPSTPVPPPPPTNPRKHKLPFDHADGNEMKIRRINESPEYTPEEEETIIPIEEIDEPEGVFEPAVEEPDEPEGVFDVPSPEYTGETQQSPTDNEPQVDQPEGVFDEPQPSPEYTGETQQSPTEAESVLQPSPEYTGETQQSPTEEVEQRPDEPEGVFDEPQHICR